MHARHRDAQNVTWEKESPNVCAVLSSYNCALGVLRECDAYYASPPSRDPIADCDVVSSSCSQLYAVLGCPCTGLKEIRIRLVSNSILDAAGCKQFRVASRIGTTPSPHLSPS